MKEFWKNSRSWKRKICTGKFRGFALPSPKTRSKAASQFNFPLLAKPTSRENENNSHLILFHILLVRNIFQQRGHSICKSLAFAFYYLLDDVVNSKVLLFALRCYLNIIHIWISLAFEYHNRLEIVFVWKSFSFGNHYYLIIISI